MRLGLVASVRDEAPYLVEWVAHHRALGFDPIMVFQNDSRDGTDALLAALDAQGLITYRDNSSNRSYRRGRLGKMPPVIRALERARNSAQIRSCDYVLVCDVDEFLVLYQDNSVAEMLARLDHPDGVSLAWRIFGSNGQGDFDPALVSERFPLAASITDRGAARPFWQVKTLFRPDRTVFWKQHRPRFSRDSARWVAADGRNISAVMKQGHILDQPALNYAAMHHYHCKSLSEFHLKIMRGYGCLTPRKRVRPGLSAHAEMDANTTPCPMPDALRQGRADIVKMIRALPGIAQAEEDAIEKFKILLARADHAILAKPQLWQRRFLPDTPDLRQRAENILDGNT